MLFMFDWCLCVLCFKYIMNCLLNSSNFGKLVSYLDIDEFLNYLFYVVKMLLRGVCI